MRARHLLLNCIRLSFFLLLSYQSYSQRVIEDRIIEVIDENGIPLPGVNVSQNGNAIDACNADGKVIINKSIVGEIEFSFLGYTSYVIDLNTIKKFPFKIQLKPDNQIIEEVLIYGRTNTSDRDISYKVEAISSKEISALQSQTTADVLAKNGAVYVQKTQMGGGSPVIRGFEANKILLVVDGVRMNNAIYRGGHLQNAITIDPLVLNRMELIYGPGSLLYGSDALGGIIHFRTKNPLIDNDLFSGGANIRFASANFEKSGNVNFSLTNQKNLASLTSLSFSDFDDLRTGNNRNSDYPEWGKRTEYVLTENGIDSVVENKDVNLQKGTAYSQFDLLQKFIYSPNKDLDIGLNIQYSRSSDVPRYDFLSEYRNGSLRYAEWNYGPQKRLMISPRMEYNQNNILFDKMIMTSAFQKIDEDRIIRNLNNTSREYQKEDLDIWSVNIDFAKKLNNHQSIEYGASYVYNDLSSTAFSEDINTEEIFSDILSRYPSGGSDLSQWGVYALHRLEIIKDKLKWNAGLRFSGQNVSLSYNQDDPIIWPQYYYDGISNKTSSLVWMTGFNYKYNGLGIKLLAGSSYRSPNVDDLAKVRVKADEIAVPNPDLTPEKNINVELNTAYEKGIFTGGVSVFHSWVDDLIIRTDGALPDGSTVFINATDTLNVTANTNVNSGRVYGISFNGSIKLKNGFSLMSNVSYVKGISISQEDVSSPLDHIPPVYGKVALSYEKNKWNFRILNLFNGEKPVSLYGGTADNLENATVDGTPAWFVINTYIGYSLSADISFSIALENILDTHYRPFASGVSAAGRNLIVSMNYKW